MRRLLFLGLIISLFFACKKTEEFPVAPEIEFKDYKRFDSTTEAGSKSFIRFNISFKDGDGDIGLKKEETIPPFNVNLIFSRYIKTNGRFELDTAGDPIDDYRIPFLTPTGRNKNIKGDISINYLLSNSQQDTSYFEMYLLDRALHKSNVVRTPEIIIDTQ